MTIQQRRSRHERDTLTCPKDDNFNLVESSVDLYETARDEGGQLTAHE